MNNEQSDLNICCVCKLPSGECVQLADPDDLNELTEDFVCQTCLSKHSDDYAGCPYCDWDDEDRTYKADELSDEGFCKEHEAERKRSPDEIQDAEDVWENLTKDD